MSKSVNKVYEAVLRVMQKSLLRAKTTSEEILSQISRSSSSEVLPLYALFLKELESRKDPQEKKKD